MSEKLWTGSMKPIMVLEKGMMTAEDIALLRENGLCVVESPKPEALRFIDPIPSTAQRGKIEHAAIELSRTVLDRNFWIDGNQWVSKSRRDVLNTFVEFLTKGTALDPDGTPDEMYERVFESEKADEVARLAREEARAERKAKKARKEAAKEAAEKKEATS